MLVTSALTWFPTKIYFDPWLSQFTCQSVEVPLTSTVISLFKLRTNKKKPFLSLSGCLLKRRKAARGVEVDQLLLNLYVTDIKWPIHLERSRKWRQKLFAAGWTTNLRRGTSDILCLVSDTFWISYGDVCWDNALLDFKQLPVAVLMLGNNKSDKISHPLLECF